MSGWPACCSPPAPIPRPSIGRGSVAGGAISGSGKGFEALVKRYPDNADYKSLWAAAVERFNPDQAAVYFTRRRNQERSCGRS